MRGIIRGAAVKAARIGVLLVAANLALGCTGGIGGLFRDEGEAAKAARLLAEQQAAKESALQRSEEEAQAAAREKEERAAALLREAEEDRERARRHRVQREEAEHHRKLRELYRDGEPPPANSSAPAAPQQHPPGDGAALDGAPRIIGAAERAACPKHPCACVERGMQPAIVLRLAGEPHHHQIHAGGAVWSYSTARGAVIEQIEFSRLFPYEVTRLRC